MALTICRALVGRGKGVDGLSLGGGVIGKGEFQFKGADGSINTSVE